MHTLTQAPAYNLSANELLTFVAPDTARRLHGSWEDSPSAVLIEAIHADELQDLALLWVDVYGCDQPMSVAQHVLAALIAEGPSSWQRGVL